MLSMQFCTRIWYCWHPIPTVIFPPGIAGKTPTCFLRESNTIFLLRISWWARICPWFLHISNLVIKPHLISLMNNCWFHRWHVGFLWFTLSFSMFLTFCNFFTLSPLGLSFWSMGIIVANILWSNFEDRSLW